MLNLGRTSEGAAVGIEPSSLATHAFILGMTGSGKTGLCAVLVEELLASKIPVIAVDSKGDLASLLLRFGAEDLEAFRSWTDDPAKAAASVGQALAALGRSPAEDAAVRSSYQGRLYTPGASIAQPLNLLGDLTPPAADDPDALARAADGIARTLLALVGLEVDPLTSAPYLLLNTLITSAWERKETPTLASIIQQVGQPPMNVIGALPLEDFMPSKDRRALMVRLNGLLASPKLAAWTRGEPLDPATLLASPDGRPRLSIYSVAHLSAEERVQAVALLLERTASWMRRRGGSRNLSAVILIDEIFGYFPPAPANPSTKPPLLALLKQARAFGVSIVLATQNPIDLDYRGLGNIGTWLVGRLQTEQDKARIRDALSAAATATNVSASTLEQRIAELAPRQFLLHSVHQANPVVLRTRDALTLLRGPFSEDELRAVSRGERPSEVTHPAAVAPTITAPTGLPHPARTAPTAKPASSVATSPLSTSDAELGPAFEVDEGVAQLYLVVKFAVRFQAGAEEAVHTLAFPVGDAATPEEVLESSPDRIDDMPFQATPPSGMTFAPIPSWTNTTKATKLRTATKNRLPARLEAKVLFDPASGLSSNPGETADAFRTRVLAKNENSPAMVALLRKLERAQADVAQAESEASARATQKWVQAGETVLGLILGRRSYSAPSRVLNAQRVQSTAEGRLEEARLRLRQLEEECQARTTPTVFEERLTVPRAQDVKLLRVSWAFIVP